MSLFRLQSAFIVSWFGMIISAIALVTAAGHPVSPAGMAGWVLLGCIPPIVMVKVFRGPGSAGMVKVIARSIRVAPKAGPVR